MISDYNNFPPNWHQISESDFAKSGFFTYVPVRTEYRQMLHPADAPDVTLPCVSATLYHMHGNNGFSIVNQYWEGKVLFFAFGCDHDYSGDARKECEKRNISLFSTNHARLCIKCGHLEITDSSD